MRPRRLRRRRSAAAARISGLYSVTFNNRLDDDLQTLEEYRRFREEAERKGFRHFLEVFDPNSPLRLVAGRRFQHSSTTRLPARSPAWRMPARPVFLKIVYHGPKAMEELVAYDPHLVVGILGGSAGTTYDAFKLIAEAQKYGARAALFGRKINQAECQLAFVQFLRLIVDREISPEEAVRAYHAVLGASSDQAAPEIGGRPVVANWRDELWRRIERCCAGSDNRQSAKDSFLALVRMQRPETG